VAGQYAQGRHGGWPLAGHPAAGAADVVRMAEPYNAKYGWTLRPDGDAGLVADANEPIGPALRVEPEVVFGWEATMRNPTRWRF